MISINIGMLTVHSSLFLLHMQEYEHMSLEELRVEDYLANRKGPGQGSSAFGQPGAQGVGLFGSSNTQLWALSASCGLFGQKAPEIKSLFDTATSTGET